MPSATAIDTSTRGVTGSSAGRAHPAAAGHPPETFEFITDAVDGRFSLDCSIDAVSQAIAPVVVRAVPKSEGSKCHPKAARLDALTIVFAQGSEQEASPSRQRLAGDVGHSFLLISDFGQAWSLDWRGHRVHLRPGDLVLADSRDLQSSRYPRDGSVVNIKMSPLWTAAWLKQPERLAGRCIARDSGWGGALSAFVSQLTPELIADAPLPVPARGSRTRRISFGSRRGIWVRRLRGIAQLRRYPMRRVAMEAIPESTSEPGIEGFRTTAIARYVAVPSG